MFAIVEIIFVFIYLFIFGRINIAVYRKTVKAINAESFYITNDISINDKLLILVGFRGL